MGKIVWGMTMSLAGFINDRDGSVEVRYPDLAAPRDTEPLSESIQNTGAVVMGRHSFDMADDPDWFARNYKYQVPIFVLTHNPPKKMPKQTDDLPSPLSRMESKVRSDKPESLQAKRRSISLARPA